MRRSLSSSEKDALCPHPRGSSSPISPSGRPGLDPPFALPPSVRLQAWAAALHPVFPWLGLVLVLQGGEAACSC